ncbi:MAG: PKD domain-containing protein [Bacteroidales bacterium]|nr:PKD domain-containing protein [Bacteroidales bacterium]
MNIAITSPTTPTTPADLGFELEVTSTDDTNLGGSASVDLSNQSFPLNITGTLTNNSNVPITVTYEVTPTLDGCASGPPKQTTVIVEPVPVVTVTNNTPEICNSNQVEIIINSPTSSTDEADLSYTVVVTSSNLPATGGTAFADITLLKTDLPHTIDGTLTNSSNAPLTVTFTVTPRLAGCTNGTAVQTTVIVEPTVAVTAVGETICSGTDTDIDVNTLFSGTNGVRYTWTVSDPSGLGATNGPAAVQFSDNIQQTLTNDTHTNPRMVTYTIHGFTIDGLGAEQCAGPSIDVEVWVEPEVEVTASGQTICSEQSTSIDVNTSYSGTNGVLYRWTVNDPDGLGAVAGSGADFSDNIVQSLTNTTTSPKMVTYTITGYTTDGTGTETCQGPSHDVEVWVEPVIEILAAGDTICSGQSTGIDVNTLYSGTLGMRYRWTVDDPDGLGAFDGSDNQFSQNIVQPLTNTTNSPKKVTYNIVGYTVDGTNTETCAGPIHSVDIWVEPEVVVTAAGQTICSGTATNIDVNTVYSGTNGVRYRWSVNDPSGLGGLPGTNYSFGTNITQTLTNTTTSARSITYTITGYTVDDDGNESCPGPPLSIQVWVEPVVVVTANSPTICYGDMAVINVNSTYSTTNGILYTWTVSAPAAITGESNGPPAGQPLSADIEQTLDLVAGTFTPQTATYTITPYATDGGGGFACTGSSLDVDVIVNPKPTANPVNHAPIIPTGSQTDIEMDGDVAGTTFGWRVLNPGTTGATDGSGLDIGDRIQQTLSNTGATPVTVTYRIGPSANGCLGDSVDVTVQIDPDVDMTVVNNAPDICTGSSTDIDISSSVSGATFSWTVDPNSVGATAGSGGPNTHTIQQTLTNTGTSPVSVVYHITPTGPAPTFIEGTTQDITVTVYPEPLALPVNNAPSICNGSSTDIDLDSDVTGTTFTWTVTDPSGASGAAASATPRPIGYTIVQALSNSGNTPVTVTYNITPTGPLPTQCVGDPVQVDVIIEPTPVANITNAAPVICSGEETDITLNASVAGSTFVYSVTDPKGTGATDGTGNAGDHIRQVLVNSTQTPVTITYEIIPYGPGSNACQGTAVYEDVTVNPLPVTSAITGADTVCEQTPDLVFSVVHTNNSFYEWYVPASIGSPTFGGTGLDNYAVVLLAADVAVMTTDSLWVNETNQYGCKGDTIYKPLTVIPYPDPADILGEASVCAYATHTYEIPGNPGSTYQWFVPPGSSIITNPALNTIDVTFGLFSGQIRVIETTAGGCVTSHNPLDVTVNMLPVVTLNADKIAICTGDLVTFTAGPAGALNYEFFLNGATVQNGGSNIYQTMSLVNDDQVTVKVTSLAGCENTSLPVRITVYDLPVVTLTSSDPDNIICYGEPVTFSAASAMAVHYNFFRNGVSEQSGPLDFYTVTDLNDGDEVYVEVLSAFGCPGASDTITTQVNPLPVAEISGDNIICPGDLTDLVVTVTTGAGPFEVTVDNGVGTLSPYNSADPIPVSPLFNTTYTLVSVTDANGCTSAVPSANLTGSASITVRDTVGIITQPRDAEVCEAVDTSFTVGASGDGLAFEWQYTDELSNPFTTITAVTPGYTGYDQATLHVVAPGASLDGYYYRVIVTGTCPEFSVSDTVQIIIKYDPTISRDPFNMAVCEGELAGFGAETGSTADPHFLWQLSTDNGLNWADLGDTAFYSGTKTDSLFIATTQSRFDGYRYRIIVTGECGGTVTSNAATLTIYERPEILDQPDNITVCENDPASFEVNAGVTSGASYLWQVDMNDGFGYRDILADSAGIYSGYNTNELLLLNPESRFDGYRYRVMVSGICSPPIYSQPATITVFEKAEIVTQPDFRIICEGQSTLFTVNAGTTTAPNYEWQVDMDNSGTFMTIGADTAVYSGHANASLILTGVPAAYDGYIYRVIVGGACPETVVSDTAILRVKISPHILIHPENDTVCEGDPATFMVDAGTTTNAAYQWQVNRYGVWEDIDDLSGDYTGTGQPVLTVNNTASANNGYLFRVLVSGDCAPPATSDYAALVIDRLPEISLHPVNREVCEDENTFFFVRPGLTTEPGFLWEYSINGSDWFAAGGLSGVSDDTNDTLHITGIPSAYDGYLFHAVISGKCAPPVTSDPAIVTVFEKPQIDDQPDDAFTCEGIPVSFSVDAGITSNPVYTWEYFNGVNWLTVMGTQFSGQGTATLNVVNPTSSLHSMNFRVVVGGYCDPPVISDTVVLTVYENAEITAHPENTAICEGDNTTFSVNPGVTTNPSFEWQYNDGINNWQIVPDDGVHSGINSGVLSLTGVPFSQDTWQYRVVITGDCGIPVTSNPADLLVYRRPEITQHPVNDTACESGSVAFSIEVGLTDVPFIQWEENDGVSGWQPIAEGGDYVGTNTTELKLFAVDSAMTGYQYHAVLSGFCEPAVISDPATLIVKAAPKIWADPTDVTVCEGNPTEFSVDATATNIGYLWQVNMNDGAGYQYILEDSAGIYLGFDSRVLILLNPMSRFDGYRYRAVVSGDCEPYQYSQPATLTVLEKAEIETQPEFRVICEYENTVFTVSAGATTAPTYEWQVDMDNSGTFVTIGADTAVYSGHANASLILTGVPQAYDGYIYRVIVGGACPETVTSDTAILRVKISPHILIHPENDTVCEGDPATFMVDAGTTADAKYQWQVNRYGVWENIDDLSGDYTNTGQPVLTVNNTVSTSSGYRFRALVSGYCLPPATSDPATLFVDRRPEISLQPVNRDICEDGDLFFVVRAGSTTQPEYLWEYSINGSDWFAAGGLSGVSDDTNDTLFITGISSAYDGYLFHAVITGKCGPPATSDPAVMTVFEKPQIDDQPVSQDACEFDTVSFSVNAGVTTNPNYQWQIFNGATWVTPPPDIYSGTNSSTLTISGVHTGIDGQQIRVIVGGQCAPEIISDTVILTVYERPEIVAQPKDVVICDGDSTWFGIDAGITTAPVITWEYFDGTDWQTATGGFFEDWDTDTIVLNGVSATWSGTGFRAVVGNLCGPNDTSIAANLLVHNRPQIVTQPVETNTCEGIPASFFVNAGVTTNPVFTWQIHNGTDWTNVTGSQYSGQGTGTLTVLNPTSAHDSVAFRVIVSGYCKPTVISDSVLLTVDENAEIALHPLSVELCEGSDTVFTVDPGATTNPSFEWFYNDGVNGWQTLPADAVHSGIHTSTLVLTNIPYSQDNWQYRAVVTGICGIPATSNPADLIVYRRPEIVLQPVNAVVCELKNASFIIDPGETDIPFIRWEVNDGVSGWVPISDGGNYIGSTTPELKLFTVDSAMNGYQYHAIVSGVCEPEVVSDPATLFVKSAPEIWQHPSDVTVCEGDNAGFSIMATGDNLHFTWQADDGSGSGFADIVNDNGGLYAGWDTPTLSLTGIDRSCDMYKYRVRVEGDCTPMKISDLAVLFVQTPPEIQLQPGNDTICEYSNASFTVTATGMGLSYQWYESTNNGASWMPLSDIGMYIGTATPSLNIFSVGRSYDGNLYHVEISGTCGDPVTSVDVILDVKTAPEILIYPENTTVCVGNPATFELEAEGSELVYRWQVNDGVSGFTDINPANPAYSGADSESLTLLSAALSQNGYSYRAIVSGTCTPPATTPPVILLVNSNPEITSQPVNRSICENGTTNFSASATGPDLVYQWYVDRNDGNGFVLLTDDENHNGADTDNLLISNAPESMDGNHYRLDVSSACLPVSTDVVTLTVWDNPVPDIQGDLPNFPLICGGDLLTLDANPSGGSGTYTSHHWSGDISPLNSVSESVVRFRTLISGTYDLVYTVTDDNGCKGSQTVSIINDRPNAQFLSDAIPSCGYLDVNFTNTSSADAVSFLWDFDDGSYSTQANPNHGFDNFDPSGMVRYYNVKLIASSENGCKDTAQSVVTIYPKVSAEIIADTTIGCHPFNVEMSSQPGAASYFWDYGDGNGEQGSYVTYHLFENYSDSITTYTTTLTTESFYGCVAEATIDITVHPIPKPNFEAVPLVQTYPDATVTFTNITQPGPWAYLWDFGDGTTSTLENPVHTYDTHGTYQVILYVSTDLCIDSVGTTVVINPRAPEAAFTAPLEGCSPLEVQFTNQSLYATTYLWDFGDGYVSTKEHPQHTYYEFGEYTVRLQVNGPGGTDYASWVITVWETPNVAFNWAPDSVFVKDKPVRFFNLTSGATNYLWDFGDYDEETGAMLNAETNFSTEEDPQHIYLTEGWKDVKLVAWNDRCIDSLLIPQAVKVIPAGDIVFPTVFRPNPGGPSGGYVDPTDPNLDPNVANSIFYPGINRQVAEYHLYIYNRWGNLIFQSDDITIGWDGYIEGNQASQGVYIWKVTGVYSNGKPFSKAGDVTLLWKRPQ